VRATAPLFAAALLIELSIAIVGSSLKAIDSSGAPLEPGFGSPARIGELFLTKFLIPFEIVSLLLLVAAVGAVVLARRETTDRPQADDRVPDRMPTLEAGPR
jgi:NADH:ubiquinone oxidoreductase subunit 6 (subunit J)